MLILPVR